MVIGAGVAGLSSIATAKSLGKINVRSFVVQIESRMRKASSLLGMHWEKLYISVFIYVPLLCCVGAIVRGFDTRAAVQEQIESLGAEFLTVGFSSIVADS